MTNSRGQDSYPRAPYGGAPGGYPGPPRRDRGDPGAYPRVPEFTPAPLGRERGQRDSRDGGRARGHPRAREPATREPARRDPGGPGGPGGRGDPGGRGGPGGPGRSGQARGRQPRGVLSWWGALPGGLGVCVVIGAALIGALGTVMEGSEPGLLLGAFLVGGTIVAALAVDGHAAYLIIPVPALAYVAAAVMAGAYHDRGIDTDHTQLLVSAGQWIANGFVAISAATILAILIAAARWIVARQRSRRY